MLSFRAVAVPKHGFLSLLRPPGPHLRLVATARAPDNAASSLRLDLSFEDHQSAFRSKNNRQLLRGYLIFTLCRSSFIVSNNSEILKICRKILGKRLFEILLRMTFYGHFVAGANQTEVMSVVERMRSFGVKAILDYSVEEDLTREQATDAEMTSCTSSTFTGSGDQADQDVNTQEPLAPAKRYTAHVRFADRRESVESARTFFYMNEAQCERNKEIFLRSIDAVSYSTNGTGLAAIKLTALGRPQLLLQLSDVIMRTRRYLSDLMGTTSGGGDGGSSDTTEGAVGGGTDTHSDVMSRQVSVTQVERSLLQRIGREHTDRSSISQFLQGLTYDQQGLIHLFTWSGLIDTRVLLSDLFRVPSLSTGRMQPLISALTTEEEEMFQNMMRRLHEIFTHATKCNVRVMVDAEQTYFQPAISRIVMEMMRKYNKEQRIVFNTYQCYLKDAYKLLSVDLHQAERQDFLFGAKLVRGAYMEQERKRALVLNYEDPINPSFEATSQMYERCLHATLANKPKDAMPAIMVATHNEQTIAYTVQLMKKFLIKPADKIICFAQLYGMCDYISFPLGQAGYSVYKYVPYGPVEDVLPYLSRRARENASVLGKISKERHMLLREIVRRARTGCWVHRPSRTLA